MHLLELFEAMKHDKNVLWDNGTYFIAGNNPTDPTFLTLWTEDNERVGQLGTRLMRRNGEDWLGVAEVSVKKPYQGERLAFRMYQALLKNMPTRYAGLIGYQPDIVSKRVHSIYKRLGAHIEDGDYYIVPNPNRQETIKDDISDDMRHEFSCGSCAFLALLLHQEFGWPMAGIFDVDPDNPDEYDDIHHIWVEIPGTGKAIDINGVTEAGQLEQDWSPQSFDDETHGVYGYDISNAWVEGFINQWNPTPQVRENIFDMARSAVQELKAELKQKGLIESRLDEVEIGRTLYHGTTKERAKEIMQNGLEPKVGALVKMAYEEYEDVVGELEPLGFAAEKEGFGAVMSAMKHHVEEMLFFATGKQRTASAEDILKYGAVLVFRDAEGEFVHRSEDHDPTDYEEHPMQVEPGDWYTQGIPKPDYMLTGQPMVRLLKRMGQWPLIGAYAPDTDVNKRALKADLVRRLIAKEPDRDKNEILAQVNALSFKELGQAQWNAQWVSEARKPREPRWDYWQFMDHYGIKEKAENLHDFVLPWVNENRPGNINKMARDSEYQLISQLALYFKLLRANKTGKRMVQVKSTLSKFEAALDTPIKVWRGGGGDYNPNRKNPRPWISFTMDKRRVKTFSQYAGTYASPAFALPERTRYWEIELTVPLRNILGYIGVGGDAEVLISNKDAKNARLITGKQKTAGKVVESVYQVYDTMEVISQMQNWNEFFNEMRDAWVGGIADFGQPQAAVNIRQHPQYDSYQAALSDAVTKYLGDPFIGYRLMAEDQIEEWQSGADMPAVAVSIEKHVALAFRKFASNQGRDDLKLVQLSVPADSVIMLGHEGEQELVVDPNWISANEIVVVENRGTVVENHIKEAPVRDFEVDPSVNQYYHGTWNRRDQAMLGNPKMADIATKRIKTGIPIDMHFAGVIQMDRSQKWMSSKSDKAGRMTDTFREILADESGVSTPAAVKNKWGVAITPAKDAITVLYMSNTNDVDTAIPFTPWIMTHRLGHSLDDAAQAGQLGSAASGARSLMEEIVVGNNEYTDLAQPISPFMTMKSARTTTLDEGEEIPELLAQYIYKGRIRLARYVHQSGRNHFKLSNGLTGDTLISNHPDSKDGNEMNKLIENVEQQLNEMAKEIVAAAIGLLVVAP